MKKNKPRRIRRDAKIFAAVLLVICLASCKPGENAPTPASAPANSGAALAKSSRAPSERELRTHIESIRKEKDRSLQSSPDSPLSPEEKASFKGLKYFPVDLGYRFEIELKPYDGKERVQMLTTSGKPDEYFRYGYFEFNVGQTPCKLDVFMDMQGKHLFLPFRDATSGKETYGAGRYLNVEQVAENRYVLDFNIAYNPYCAYNPQFVCPIPPKQNTLKAEIRAGEKNYHD